ncbi:Ras-related protein ced-10 [Chionoecetes opilio]|uniref:Ras-related protein ced-10 n=1 Tax=Chionoecetes opilio TaxID=41210 RepID=A0A8J4Y6Q7_CHIOP|nr:Ras-related protein ced-10 [Chionoecetes opilio]
MNSQGRVLKMVAVGDGYVGKTSLLITHTTGTFCAEYVPTVFENYAGSLCVNGSQYAYTLWDTAGQEAFDNIRVLCYAETNVFFVCFAVNSPTSFANVKSIWVPEIKKVCGDTVKTVLVGTKADLRSSCTNDVVKRADAKRLARTLKMHGYVECSAKDMTGCNEVFHEGILAATQTQSSSSWFCPIL